MKNLTLLSMGFLLYSCNEKISPELETGATAGPAAIVPTDYYFKVENTSPDILNYKLHRTGANNETTPCAVTSNSSTYGALSSENYSDENTNVPATTMWDSKQFDISCYFEAEELSLFYTGFNFEVSASPNTCTYVGYAPFSFYDKIPGSSSTTYTYVNCAVDVIGLVGTEAAAAVVGNDTLYGANAGTNLECGQYADTNIAFNANAAIERNARNPENEEDLCKFNYTDVDCDEGEITINTIDVAWVAAAAADDPLTPLVNEMVAHPVASEGQQRTLSCGGDHMNCVKGPLKALSNVYAASSTELHPTTYNEAFSTEYSYGGGYGSTNSNKTYVNFRRNLADPDIAFGTSVPSAYPSAYYTTYGAAFATPETSYQPLLADLYSYNLKWLGVNEVITPAALATQSVALGYTATPYAAEPFLGFGDHKVNPFYTFYCFDEAYEIKGRIRMVVREWDRVFPTATTSLTYISDIGATITGVVASPITLKSEARQDYPTGMRTENPGDPDGYNAYNDLRDWDDYLFMTRAAGAVTTTTIWQPASGFFSSAAFTNGDL